MKPLAYLLATLSLLWIDVAWRAATAAPAPLVRTIVVQPSNFIVPLGECARTCQAKARSHYIGLTADKEKTK